MPILTLNLIIIIERQRERERERERKEIEKMKDNEKERESQRVKKMYGGGDKVIMTQKEKKTLQFSAGQILLGHICLHISYIAAN